jgi:hypothetical protein
MTRMREMRRGKRWVVIALAGGVLSALAVALVLAAPARSIPFGAGYGLSEEEDGRWSYFPDISVSPDGERVAVVWSETYSEAIPSGHGSVKLRWASETEGSGWRTPVTVFDGSEEACAAWTAVAVTETTAHIAYVVARPCVSSTEQAIYYRTYDLGGALGASKEVASRTLAAAEPGFGKVDIAVDAYGNLHFLYIYYPTEGIDLGTVYYRQLLGGSLEPEETVSGGSARNPAVTWGGGYVHAVWEDLSPTGRALRSGPRGGDYARAVLGSVTQGEPQIKYLPRDEDEWQQSKAKELTNNLTTHIPRNPDIAARGDQVVVVWDWEWEAGRYALTYARYLGGTNWLLGREVGTEADISDLLTLPDPEQVYTSTSAQDASPYLKHLRPSVALDSEGKPTIAWHANLGPTEEPGDMDYSILYIQAQSMTVSGTTWLTPTVLNPSVLVEHSGGPVVAMAAVTSPHIHVAYSHNPEQTLEFGDWDTYYFGVGDSGNGSEPSASVHLPIILRAYPSETLLDRPTVRAEPLDDRPAELYRRQEERDG